MDSLAVFETADPSGSTTAPARYAIRQALDQEYHKYLMRQRADAPHARHQHGGDLGSEVDLGVLNKQTASTEVDGITFKAVAVRRDFFGRTIDAASRTARDYLCQNESGGSHDLKMDKGENVWVSYHEGFSNAVRKPITLEELMRGF